MWTGRMDSRIKSEIAQFQKEIAEALDRITRISHSPGKRLHTSCAASVPIRCLRQPRRTKNSAMSHTSWLSEISEPLFTRANPASLPSNRMRNGCRVDSLQYSGSDL